MREVGRAHVEVGTAARPGSEEGRAALSERLPELVPNLIAAGTDAGPEGDQEVGRTRTAGDERFHRGAHDPGRGSSPTGVRGGDPPALWVHQQHGQTVGRLDPDQEAGRVGNRRVGLRKALEGCFDDTRAVDLLQEM